MSGPLGKLTVDRAKFRELCTLLAAARGPCGGALLTMASVAACASTREPASAEVHIPAQPQAPPRTPMAVAPKASSSSDADPGSPEEEGGSAEDEPDDSASCGEVDVAQVRRPAGKCSDATGSPGACVACAGFPFVAAKCASYTQNLKPKVAEATLTCLRGLSAKSRCDACAVYACGDRAMKASCPDPTAAADCRAWKARCPGISVDVCDRYVSALTPTGRAKMRACMTSCSLFSCAESL